MAKRSKVKEAPACAPEEPAAKIAAQMMAAGELVRRAGRKTTKSAVHDARVSVRRCRALASALGEVSGHELYEKVNSLGKKLFRRTSPLRDAQVRKKWAKELARGCGPVWRKVLKTLEKTERAETRRTRKALQSFQLKKWSRLAARLAAGEAGPFTAADLKEAAMRLTRRISELDRKARKSGAHRDYHKLRIAYKKYRYFLDAFFPGKGDKERPGLKAVQDALGDAHDLSGLLETVNSRGSKMKKGEIEKLRESIEKESAARIASYHRMPSNR